MELIQGIGQIIRIARLREGLTQQELADRVNLHFTAISRMERADRLPRIDTLAQVADGLGMALWELIRQAEELRRIDPGPRDGSLANR
jgi:transcriptional regulator with XRE-family HTH domain